MFKDVNEANEVLADPKKRAAYDQLGHYSSGQEFRPPPDWGSRFGGGGADIGGMDLSDLFAQMFGGMGAGMGGGRARSGFSTAARGRDVESTLRVSLEEAFSGVERTVLVSAPGTPPRSVKIRVPAGVEAGKRLRVSGKGEAGAQGQAGDLYLRVEIDPHPLFRLEGRDLYLDTPVLPWEAALGTQLLVPTLAGSLRMKIPAGAKSGQKLRLPGKGLPAREGAGDLYVQLRIVLPESLTSEEKALYERLMSLSEFNPRPGFPRE